jgi:membrane fusion protein, multidrug efflux system
VSTNEAKSIVIENSANTTLEKSTSDPSAKPVPSTTPESSKPVKKRGWKIYLLVCLILAIGGSFGVPWVIESLNTVSTDDAYVNGHVTFVAPRVPGQVVKVLVDDNNRVKKGDLLVQLDKEPYQVQVNIAKSAVEAAKADLIAAEAQTRGTVGHARSLRFALEHAVEDVENQISLLRLRVASLQSQKASVVKAQADFDRATPLVKTGAISKEEYDLRRESLLVAQAKQEEALQAVYQVRVSLGLPPKPENSSDLAKVPPDIDQTFSTVRQAQASLIEAVSLLGITDSFDKSPKQMIADFYKRDPKGDIDRIYEKILKDAPTIKQAQTKLAQAQRNLDQAELNLRYCDVVAEIDGVVTRRNVNPGNNVVVGQNLMAVRSLTEIWVDANFKETQLSHLRIGQLVDLEVDMYGSHQLFKGRISGFTMGTGSTLALLPAENATGNFVKVVQRLPVRIELMDYDPDKNPLFIGLSVTPSVRIKEPPTGPDAGKFLQPHFSTTTLAPQSEK